MEKKLIIINEGIDYDIKSKEDAIDAIFEEYERLDDSMYDVLASVAITGFSVEDVFEIYAECMKRSDKDVVYRITDDMEEVTEEIRNFLNKQVKVEL